MTEHVCHFVPFTHRWGGFDPFNGNMGEIVESGECCTGCGKVRNYQHSQKMDDGVTLTILAPFPTSAAKASN